MTKGIVCYKGQPVHVCSLSTDELMSSVFDALKGNLVHGTMKPYNPIYQFANVMGYIQNGDPTQLTFITSDQGLRYAVEELRKRMIGGYVPEMEPLL